MYVQLFWLNLATWTAATEAKDVQRYVWESTNTTLNQTYLPFVKDISNVSKNGLIFRKHLNGSYLMDFLPNRI